MNGYMSVSSTADTEHVAIAVSWHIDKRRKADTPGYLLTQIGNGICDLTGIGL